MAREMDERELLSILKEEETDASSFYASELATAQADSMDRYYSRPYGDEVEGRSAVVTHDIEDAINWIMPHIMRLFLQNDELITVEDDRDDDKARADQIGDYLSHVFFRDNPGEVILHDFAFDGMLQKIGVVSVNWQDPEPSPPKEVTGVYADQLQRYIEDPEYKILSQDSEIKVIGGAEVECFDLELRHTPAVGRVVIEQVPPEEFAFSRRAKSVDDADYHRRKTEEYVAELARMFPDSARDLDPENYTGQSANDDEDVASDPRTQARFQDEADDKSTGSGSQHRSRRKVDLVTEYIRIDYDGDGIVELRQIKRVGNTILENIEVEESEFVTWSPIRVSHKLVGRSLTDTLCDIQKIRTVVTRKLLDSLSQSLAPRRIVNKNRLGEAGIDQLLDHDIGDVIESDGDPREAVFELVTPDVSQSAYAALEYFDQRSEEASGVTRHAQGLKAQAITDTAKGIESLQSAANSRIELIGRWMGHGVEQIFRRVFSLLAAHQDGPRLVKLQGKPLQIDPRTWSDQSTVTLHVGQAAESREAKLVKLGMIYNSQKEIIMQMGQNNPVCGIPEARETLALMAREAGFKDPSRFFKELPPNWQPPPEADKQDPKLVEVQGKMQLAQHEAQAKQKLSQAQAAQDAQQSHAKMQFDQQATVAKIQGDQQIAEQKFQHEAAINEARMQSEKEIAQMRIESETQLAMVRMNAEMDLARWKTEQEMELAREAQKAKADAADTNLNGGFRPGGALDA